MTTLALLQGSITEYGQWGIAGAIIFLVIVFFGFMLRSMPTWRAVKQDEKEIKLAEIAVREKEAEARTAQATSFAQLSEVLNNVAVHQRNETEGMRIMQRVAAQTAERMEDVINDLVATVEKVDARLGAIEKELAGKRHGLKAKASPTD